MSLLRAIVGIGVCLGVAQLASAQSSVFGTNLIVNGGAESGPGGDGTAKVSSIPGWQASGGCDIYAYATAYMNIDGVAPTDIVPRGTGNNYFAGGRSTRQLPLYSKRRPQLRRVHHRFRQRQLRPRRIFRRLSIRWGQRHIDCAVSQLRRNLALLGDHRRHRTERSRQFPKWHVSEPATGTGPRGRAIRKRHAEHELGQRRQ